MKTLTCCVLWAFGLLAGGCKKDDASAKTQACSVASNTVKTVTNAAGIVYYNPTTQEYRVSVHQPGTYDSVDSGVVCGTLPAALQADGTTVYVTGTFKEYGQAPPQPLPADSTYYYLEIASISRR